MATADEPPPLLHPNMAVLYAERIGRLYEHLQKDETRSQATETFCSLVHEITLMPDDGELAIVLRGDLAAILRFAAGKQNPNFMSELEALDRLLTQGSLVARRRNRRSLRKGAENAETYAAGPAEVSQLSLVAGAGFVNCFRMFQATIPPNLTKAA